MRISIRSSGSLVLSLLSLAACQTAAPLGEGDRAAIASVEADWKRAVLAGDHAALAATYAEDCVLLPPNAPRISGRAAVRGFFAAMPKIVGMELEKLEVDGHGDLAYVCGTYKMSLQVPGVQDGVQDRGKFIEIWRRSSAGSWQIARDMFSSDLPAPAAK